MIDRCDWNLILMLDLLHFNHRNKPMELETPCFWYQKLVTRKLDRMSWALAVNILCCYCQFVVICCRPLWCVIQLMRTKHEFSTSIWPRHPSCFRRCFQSC